MRAIRRAWLSSHSVVPALIGLVGLAVLTWAVGQGVVKDRLTNPLGDTYASLSVTLILPVLATTVLPLALHDRVAPGIALAARSMGWVRAGWWLLGVAAVFVTLAPVQGLIGAAQLRIDIGLLGGLSTLALCGLGLGPALAVPLLLLLPHLARHSGAPPRWWTVLATDQLGLTGAAAAGVAVAGLATFALVGPRYPADLAGSGSD